MTLSMELLLNLVWLLLAVPAYWLWRSTRPARASRQLGSMQCLLALSCVLVLLFPVISATDDLHAMRAEMEESSSRERTVRQASSDRVSAAYLRLLSPPALVVAAPSFALGLIRTDVGSDSEISFQSSPALVQRGRAPPTTSI